MKSQGTTFDPVDSYEPSKDPTKPFSFKPERAPKVPSITYDYDDEIPDDPNLRFAIQTRQDLAAKTLIRDLIVYILFVICSGFIGFAMSSSHAVYFSRAVENAFMDTPVSTVDVILLDRAKRMDGMDNTSRSYLRMDGGIAGGVDSTVKSTLRSTKTIDGLWDVSTVKNTPFGKTQAKYLENTFVGLLFWNNWYSEENPVQPTSAQDDLFLFTSKLLGTARIRQLRVTSESCVIHSQASHLFDSCYGFYTEEVEDSEPMTNIKNDEFTGTGYRHSILEGTRKFSGKFGRYSQNGYFMDLTLARNICQYQIQELRKNVWINRGTRAIIIDFTMYNNGANLFCVCKIVLEFPPTGGLFPSAEFFTQKLLRYVTDRDFVVLGFEMSFLFFVLYYIIETVSVVKSTGSEYFMEFWNIFDFLIVSFSVCAALSGIQRWFGVEEEVYKLVKIKYAHPAFDNPRYYHEIFNNVFIALMFLLCIKLFKYLRINPTFNELSRALAKSINSVYSFTAIFCIIFFAFAQFAYLIFGTEVEDYRSVYDASMSLLQAVLGKLNYQELEEANFIMGPFFLIFFVFFIFFILMNMFGAVIIESYKIVRSQTSESDSDTLAGTYLAKIFTNILPFYNRNVLHTVEESSMYTKIRDALQRAGYNDNEIEAFFNKYKITPDFDVTKSQGSDLLAKLELRKFDFDPANFNKQTIAVLQKDFDKMKIYVEELENKVDSQIQQLRWHYLENHKMAQTQTPAWTLF